MFAYILAVFVVFSSIPGYHFMNQTEAVVHLKQALYNISTDPQIDDMEKTVLINFDHLIDLLGPVAVELDWNKGAQLNNIAFAVQMYQGSGEKFLKSHLYHEIKMFLGDIKMDLTMQGRFAEFNNSFMAFDGSIHYYWEQGIVLPKIQHIRNITMQHGQIVDSFLMTFEMAVHGMEINMVLPELEMLFHQNAMEELEKMTFMVETNFPGGMAAEGVRSQGTTDLVNQLKARKSQLENQGMMLV